MRRVAPSGHVVYTGAKLQLKIESAKGNAEKNPNERIICDICDTPHSPFIDIECSAAGRNTFSLVCDAT